MRTTTLLTALAMVACGPTDSELPDGPTAADGICESLDPTPELAGCTVTAVTDYVGGPVLSSYRYHVDSSGLADEYTEYDSAGERTHQVTWERDARGRAVRTVETWRINGEQDVAIDATFGDGCEVENVEWDYGIDGTVDMAETWTREEHEWPLLVVGITSSGFVSGDGETAWRVEYTQSSTSTERRYDSEDDGTIDSFTYYEYDSEGRTLLVDLDVNNDGQTDRLSAWSQGPDGWVEYERQVFSDLIDDEPTTESRTYVDGRVATQTNDNDSDGVINQLTTYVYDEQGRTERIKYTVNPDSAEPTKARTVYTYACDDGSQSALQRTPPAWLRGAPDERALPHAARLELP